MVRSKSLKPIWVLDDDPMHTLDVYRKIFKNRTIVHFTSDVEALSELSDIPADRWPEALIADAFAFGQGASKGNMMKGFQECYALLMYMNEKAGIIPRHIAFVSNDLEMAQNCKASAQLCWAFDDIKLYASGKYGDIELAHALVDKTRELGISAAHAHEAGFSFLEFVNEVAGLNLPISYDQLKRIALEGKRLSFQGVLDMASAYKLSAQERCELLRGVPESSFVKKIDDACSFSANHHCKKIASFDKKCGENAKGHLAFSTEDVRTLLQNGCKPVLVINSICELDHSLMPALAGLVVFSPEGAGHLSVLAESHALSVLTGLSPDKILVLQALPSGAPVTLTETPDPALYHGHIPDIHLRSTQSLYELELAKAVCNIFSEATQTHDLRLPALKANLDHQDQIKDSFLMADGIGLVRTEHFVLANDIVRGAFVASLLSSGNQTERHVFMQEHAQQITEIFERLATESAALPHKNFPVRVRLMDAKMAEFLPQEAYAHVPDELRRGVQMGLAHPWIYESQLNGVLNACKNYANPNLPIEVMVPMVRSLDELLHVREMSEKLSRNHGFSTVPYSLGIMLETKEALRDVKLYVPHTDFIGIGTNDLVSDVLGMDRADMKARLAYRNANGYDPFEKLPPIVLEKTIESITAAHAVNPSIKFDVCGIHGRDMGSVTSLLAHVDGLSLSPKQRNMYALRADLYLKALRDSGRTNQPVRPVSPAARQMAVSFSAEP